MPIRIYRLVALALVALAVIVMEAGGQPARANHNVEVGVDVNTTATPANTATSLGTIETCRVVGVTTQFNIDIYIKNVSNLIATEIYFQYDAAKLKILSKQIMLQAAQAGSTITDDSEDLPDTYQPGIFRVGAVETGQTNDAGSGALFRLNMKAIGTGLSPAKISKIDADSNGTPDLGITLRDKDGLLIGDTADVDPFFDGTTTNAAVYVGSGTTCSSDSDSDGVPDAFDNRPGLANPGQQDWNLDGIGDACQDFDGDGHLDPVDNCPGVANPDQANMDGDPLGDVCDPDRDGDGTDNTTDNCPNLSNPNQANADGDANGDACDDDDDNDTWRDTNEQYLTTNPLLQCGTNAYPPDFDDTWLIDISDVLALKPAFGSDVTTSLRRYDLVQSAAIDINDVLTLKPLFGTNCPPS